jgi:hypothetical protein
MNNFMVSFDLKHNHKVTTSIDAINRFTIIEIQLSNLFSKVVGLLKLLPMNLRTLNNKVIKTHHMERKTHVLNHNFECIM